MNMHVKNAQLPGNYSSRFDAFQLDYGIYYCRLAVAVLSRQKIGQCDKRPYTDIGALLAFN